MAYQERIFNLAKDINPKNRRYAAYAFTSFSDFPDKERAWEDLHRLTEDDDRIVRQNAARAFTSFSDFPDKEKAWEDLHRLTEDDDRIVRQNAARAFTSFSDFPDKEKAWEDLHRLTGDENSVVRQNAAYVFHFAYDKVSQKDELLERLFKLTEDKSNRVKAASYYSLAKIYVHESLKAGTKHEFEENYNEAIKFFEKAYSSQRWDTVNFCFTVHGLFYKILTGDVKSVDEIQNSISLWKNKPAKSEERQHLLEILESLGNVLEESLIAKRHGEDVWGYKDKVLPYCNRADESIKELKHEGIREIATKAKIHVEDEYSKTIDILLNKVNKLLNEPEYVEKQLFPIIREYCELITEPAIREKIKLDISEIQREKNGEVRIKLGLRLLKDIKYQLEILSKHKDKELKHKSEIMDIKDKESQKGWDMFRFFQPKEITEHIRTSKWGIRKILEILAISLTIAGVVWAIVYAGLIEMDYPTAMRESLIIFTIISFLILIILFMKK